MKRRKFSREFKIEAVRLESERGVSVSQACRDLDLAESVLRRWMNEFARIRSRRFPATASRNPSCGDRPFRREVAKLKAERDILKKAAAYFAREST